VFSCDTHPTILSANLECLSDKVYPAVLELESRAVEKKDVLINSDSATNKILLIDNISNPLQFSSVKIHPQRVT